MKENEKLDITLAKGAAIFLVVVGHILAGGHSLGNDWFSTFVDYIYLFHMPFFMFISGYTYFKLGRPEKLLSTYLNFLKKQLVRLLLPFLFMGAVIVAGKLAMQSIVHIDNTPDNIFLGFINLLWYTKESASVFLWYIFALFVYGSISPILLKTLRNSIKFLLLLSLVILLVPPIHYFYLDKLTFFFFFFVFGGLARHKESLYTEIICNKKTFIALTILFLGSFLLFESDIIPDKFNKFITGILCIPIFHQACIFLMVYKNKTINTFLYIGRHSYIIYLLNTICIGLTKAIIFLVIGWDYYNFYLVAPILITAGLLGPLIAEWLIFKRIPFINTHILGNPSNKAR